MIGRSNAARRGHNSEVLSEMFQGSAFESKNHAGKVYDGSSLHGSLAKTKITATRLVYYFHRSSRGNQEVVEKRVVNFRKVFRNSEGCTKVSTGVP